MYIGPNIKTSSLVLSMDALNYKSYIRDYNLIDYSNWTLGDANPTGFYRNGSIEENIRIIDTDPWGNEVVVWEGRPEGERGANGGWTTSSFTIDNTKIHRFTVWLRRTVIGDGNFYNGTIGYGSINGIYNRSNGAINTNAYFQSGKWSYGVNESEWMLAVGHVHVANSGVGPIHVDTGLYTVNGGKISNYGTDFVWMSETTSAKERSYLYYSTDTSTRQQFCYPRVDACDGSEPSIDELLNATQHRWKSLYGKNTMDVIGPKWHHEGYFNFKGDGTPDGVVQGDRISGFGGVADTRLYPDGMTISWWQRLDSKGGQRQSVLFGSSTIKHVEFTNILTASPSFRTEAGMTNNYSFGSGIIPGGSMVNKWIKFDIVFDFKTSPRSVKWYKDGELFYTHNNFDNSTAGVNEYFQFTDFGRSTGSTNYNYASSFSGDLAKIDIYGKPLSSVEIGNNYKAFKSRFL